MRKIISSTMVSMNSVMENPQFWSMSYWNDELQKYVYDQLFGSDALIMGRATYDGFAEAWSSRAGADEFADRMNSLPKYVASRTLEKVDWTNTSIMQGDVVEAIRTIKAQSGQDILQYGCGELTHTLLQHGLVDEIRVLVYPIVVENGIRIFEDVERHPLKLIETKTFDTGVVAMHYQPISDEA